jgi:hypothetical protein
MPATKLVVSRAGLRLQDTDAAVCIESCILAAVAEVNEVGSGIIKEPIPIGLDLEVMDQPESFTLENSHVICGGNGRSYWISGTRPETSGKYQSDIRLLIQSPCRRARAALAEF